MKESFRVRWQGQVTGPLEFDEIERRLASNQIGMLHEVEYQSAWISLRRFTQLRQAREQAHRARVEQEARKEREQADQLARQKAQQMEQEKLAEMKRQNDLHEQRASQPIPSTQPSDRAGPSGLSVLGIVLLVIGMLIAAYFFLIFDQSVESGLGMRMNNFGLMADRQNGVVLGLGLSIVGTIMLVLGNHNKH